VKLDNDYQPSGEASGEIIKPSFLGSNSQGVPFFVSRFSPGSSEGISSNMPAFLCFMIIAWGGFGIVLYTALKKVRRRHMMDRFWSPFLILMLAGIVSLLANIMIRLCSNVREESPTKIEEVEGGKEVVNDVEEGLEMETMKSLKAADEMFISSDDHDDGDEQCSEVSTTPLVELLKREGRPSLPHLLLSCNNTRHPGLFTCGPMGLIREIRKEVQAFRTDTGLKVSLHEESFEM